MAFLQRRLDSTLARRIGARRTGLCIFISAEDDVDNSAGDFDNIGGL